MAFSAVTCPGNGKEMEALAAAYKDKVLQKASSQSIGCCSLAG